MRLQRTSLRSQIVGIVAVIGAVITTLVAFLLAVQQRDSFFNQYSANLEIVSQRVGFDLEVAAGDLSRDVRLLSNHAAVQGIARALANGGVDPLVNFRLETWMNSLSTVLAAVAEARPAYYQIRLIGVTDNGRELVRIERTDNGIVSVSEENLQQKGDRDYFRGALGLQRGELYFSSVDLNKEFGVLDIPYKPTLRVATPVIDTNGEVFGLIVINWDMGIQFTDIAEQLRASSGIEEIQTYITNSNGDYLFHPDPGKTFGFEFGESYRFQNDFLDKVTVANQQPLGDSLPDIAESSLFTANLDDEQVYVLARPVTVNPLNPSSNFYVLEVIAHSVLDSAVLQITLQFWTSAIAVGAAVLLLLVWLLSRQLAPLYKLSDAARRIAQGDYQIELPSPQSTEIGELADAIARMEHQISRREKELLEHRDQLEATVETRTKELVVARDEAKRQATFKGEFLANMSHEIRTPMTAIIGLLEVIRRTDMNTKQQQYINQIHNSSNALLHIINDILDISKIEAGKIDIEHVEFSLLDTLEGVVDLFAPSADLKAIDLHLNMDPEIANLLIGDKVRLTQVLNNLVGNAIKFTHKGEVILSANIVSNDADTTRVRLEVADTGIGINAEAMSRLFTAFEQADRETTRLFGGTGLGLAISQKLVELMGGTLLARSEPDKGSVFWFELDFSTTDILEPKLALSAGFNKRVLLIDDNPVASEILQNMLVSWGCHVHVANSGQQGLERIAESTRARWAYNFILVDWQLDGVDGYTYIDQIHAQLLQAELPALPSILMLTEGERRMLRDSSQFRENITVITKPVTVSRLLSSLQEMKLIDAIIEKQPDSHRTTLTHQLKQQLMELPAPAKILLAEDNKTNQLVIQELLSEFRFQFIIANNGAEAVDTVKTQSPDLVLMDLQMPIMDGFEATREIRKLGYTLPILSLSAATFIQDVKQASRAGMDAHLSKPIDFDLLLAALLNWLPFTTVSVTPDADSTPATATIRPELAPSTDKADALVTALKNDAQFDLSGTILAYAGTSAFYRIVRAFWLEFNEQVQTIGLGASWGQDEKRRFVHSLKGAAHNIGATELARMAADAEHAIIEGDDSSLESVIQNLEDLLLFLNKHLT